VSSLLSVTLIDTDNYYLDLLCCQDYKMLIFQFYCVDYIFGEKLLHTEILSIFDYKSQRKIGRVLVFY
jgi:hypothetical protein